MKYFHPVISDGALNWDSVFVGNVEKLKRSDNKNFNIIVNQLLTTYILPESHNMGDSIKTVCVSKSDWIFKNKYLSEENRQLFLKIINEQKPHANYYYYIDKNGDPNFERDSRYAAIEFPDENYRILALSRYWNAIQYYYPYRDLIEEDWDEVLQEFIPKVMKANNLQDYNLAMSEFATRIRDGHAIVFSNERFRYIGKYHWPFELKYIKGKTIVSGIYSLRKAKNMGIKIGDEIISINGIQVIKERERLKILASASNINREQEVISYCLASSQLPTGSITFFNGRDTINTKTTLKTGLYYQFKGGLQSKTSRSVTTTDHNIGYINLERIKSDKRFKKALQKIKNTHALIMDLRCYPSILILESMVTNFNLNIKEVPFVKYAFPDTLCPGKFNYREEMLPLFKSKSTYNGQVIVLVNSNTLSFAEYFLMALQKCRPVTVIGETTAGSDGTMCMIKLPGNLNAAFTGVGISYPDGRQTQKVGIPLDVRVEITQEGIRQGKDEILERAHQFLKDKK